MGQNDPMLPDPHNAPRQEAPRPRIPGYDVGDVIGRGATGIVYRARQLAVDREVALKVLHPELSSKPRLVRRLQREARTTARLAHPHVVSAIDMGETDGRWWYAMEYVDGPSLALRLRQEGRLKEREALRLFIPLCEALEHLWEHGVVHRDIKPANILIDRAGGARLADLGLAFADDDPSVTKEGGTLGTPHYISPEQAISPGAADVRSDIWSYGATLFHSVTGRPPFAGESAAEILSGVLYARIPDPLELEPSLSKGLSLVLRKCLTREPDGRYRSPHELLLDLERVRERRHPNVRRSALDPVARRPDERRIWLGAAGVVVLAIIVILIGLDPFGRRSSGGARGSDQDQAVYEPLEALASRAELQPLLLAQHQQELADLQAELPRMHQTRWMEIDRELRVALRASVLDIKRAIERQVDRELEALDFAGAQRTLDQELPRRVFDTTGHRITDLEGWGATIASWHATLDARVRAASVAAMEALRDDLAGWMGHRLEEVDRRLERQEWNAGLSLLVEGRDGILAAAGRRDVLLPAELLDAAVEPVANELLRKRLELARAWEQVDRDLARRIRAWRELLEEELESGPPRPRAAEDLTAQFERELDRVRLAREEMPTELARTSLAVLARAREDLELREQELLEDDARLDFEDAEKLCTEYWSGRRYAEIAGLWKEVRARMSGLAERTDAGWRDELERISRLREEEARILQDLLARAADRLVELNGRRVDFRVGSITYPDVRILSGTEPLGDGFRLEGFPELGTLDIRELPTSQLLELGGLGTLMGGNIEPDLSPHDRLLLALFLFHDGRPGAAREVLNSGTLPGAGTASEIEGDLSGRVLDSVHEEREQRKQRETEAERHLELVFDDQNQGRAPSNVLARIELLIGEYADLALVRRRLPELRALRTSLRQETRPSDEEAFGQAYGPTRMDFPRLGRVRLAFDFLSRSVGAWQRGEWEFDGTGWARREAIEDWDGLRSEVGPRLYLRPPLDVGSFEVAISFEQVTEGPPQLLLVSVAGFHVALVGPGLPGGDGSARYLIGTEPLDEFLVRLQDGEGRSDAELVRAGGAHRLVLSGYRPSGRLRIEVDGRTLDEMRMLKPARGPDPRIEFRSWDPVRLTRVVLEAGR